MRRKISWTDGRTDRGKTVYPPPPSGSGGIYLGYQYLHDSQVSAIQGMSYLGYQYLHDSQVSAIQGVS
jgi:hypothetical protein